MHTYGTENNKKAPGSKEPEAKYKSPFILKLCNVTLLYKLIVQDKSSFSL